MQNRENRKCRLHSRLEKTLSFSHIVASRVVTPLQLTNKDYRVAKSSCTWEECAFEITIIIKDPFIFPSSFFS